MKASGLLLLCCTTSVSAQFILPDLGTWTGHYEASVGAHVWQDRFDLRNLQFQNTTNLGPGLRLNAVIRSNDQLHGIKTLSPTADELYLEHYGFYSHSQKPMTAYSVRLGDIRYLRTPYPDITAMFDQVPGVEDLEGMGQSKYRGLMFQFEHPLNQIFGVHGSFLQWVKSDQHGFSAIESYAYARKNWTHWDLEARAGRIQAREFPLGRGANGYSLYGGYHFKGYRIGFLYERNHLEHIRTGVLLEFAPSKVTNLLGRFRTDYTRSPEGLGLQPAFLKGHYGFAKAPPEGATRIGQVTAERTTTYWQNGQSRNFYEHIVDASENISGQNIVIVPKTKPRYLRIESLVSKQHHFSSSKDFRDWEAQRQGPAQLAQPVTYEYYQVAE